MNLISKSIHAVRRLFFLSIATAATVSAQSTLSLDVGQAADTINREIYGGLLENFGRDIYTGLYVGTASSVPNVNGMRKDVITAFKECGVTILDWPGGCFAENYNWVNGIGPKTGRPSGDMTNGMGTNEYFQLCDSLKAIPYITANVRTQSTATMVAWLNYIDTAFPNRLKYWKMGNEPWGGCEGAGIPAISITDYINRYNQYKSAIPSKWSGKLIRIADGGTADYLYKVTWIDSLMKCEMGGVEGVTLHYYGAFSGASIDFPVNEYYNRIQVALGISSKLAIYDSIMAKYDPDYTVGLMVDEWGAWYSNAPGKDYPQSSCRDAVIASLNLNMFNNRCRRIKMGCVAQPVNTIQSLILTENPAQNRIVKTPTFYVFKMYKVHQQATMVPATLKTSNNQNIPIISASSSVDSTKNLHISLCNTHATATHTVTITLNNAPAYASCTGTIVSGPAYNSYNNFGAAENVNIKSFTGATYSGNTVTVTMPAFSVVTLELTPPQTSVNENAVSNLNLRGINAGLTAEGSIVVRYSTLRAIPLSLTLYGIDGRAILASSNETLDPDRNSFVWNLRKTSLQSNVYILKISAGNESKAQRLIATR
jgi:alpha-N-arabinofuranosidase